MNEFENICIIIRMICIVLARPKIVKRVLGKKGGQVYQPITYTEAMAE